jgi:hypothetical protein
MHMPNLAQHQSNDYTKLLLIGHPKSGKTGAMAPLVPDFDLRILDMDNGLDTLKAFVQKDYPDRLKSVEYRTLRDTYKMTPLGPECVRPTAFNDAMKMLTHWKYDDVDLGPPAEWGPDCILVLDSLTFLGTAAFNAVEPISGKDKRAAYGNAQRGLEKILAIIQSDYFQTNVIVISHVRYIELDDGKKKGFPTSIGEALSPVIPRYFTSVALCEVGAGGKRTIQTAATSTIDLANPKPFEMLPKYPIETGLADFFKVLRSQPDAKRNIQTEEKKVTTIHRR